MEIYKLKYYLLSAYAEIWSAVFKIKHKTPSIFRCDQSDIFGLLVHPPKKSYIA